MEHSLRAELGDLSNLLYLPIVISIYVGCAYRFFKKWRSVMKWPDILLVSVGLLMLAITAISPTVRHFNGPELTDSQPKELAESATLKEDNAKLKTENARLKKATHSREVAAAPVLSSEAQTPISANLSADDCDDLTRAQELRDSAEANLIKAAPIQIGAGEGLYAPPIQFGAGEGPEKYQAALNTERATVENLQRVEGRLCAQRKTH